MVLTTWALAVLFGIFCGLVFWDLELTIAGIQNRAGALFFCLVFLAFLSVTSIDSLLSERLVVNKEQRLGYYPGILYMISKCLLDSLLLRAVPAVLFSVPVYYMANLQRDTERFMLFVFIMISFTIAAQFQAMLLVEWVMRAGNAMVLFVLILIVQMLFAGFLVNADSVNKGIAWIRYLSLFYYAWEAVAINEFEVWCLLSYICNVCLTGMLCGPCVI
jgi:ABC-type multidrug transport system permease subunit